MATRILVPGDMIERVQAFISSRGVPLEVVRDGEADVRVVRSEGRSESDGSTLQAGGWISCHTARETGERLGIELRTFGTLLDALDIKVRECELGCF